jgi:hypothetical protein
MSREFDINIYVGILVERSVRIGARMSREFDMKLICTYTSGE